MVKPTTPSNLIEAQEAAEKAIRRVELGPSEQWIHDNLPFVKSWLRRQELGFEFTSQDVWNQCNSLPPEPRAMGALMRHLRGLARPTDRMTPSANRTNHNRPLRVWRKT